MLLCTAGGVQGQFNLLLQQAAAAAARQGMQGTLSNGKKAPFPQLYLDIFSPICFRVAAGDLVSLTPEMLGVGQARNCWQDAQLCNLNRCINYCCRSCRSNWRVPRKVWSGMARKKEPKVTSRARKKAAAVGGKKG